MVGTVRYEGAREWLLYSLYFWEIQALLCWICGSFLGKILAPADDFNASCTALDEAGLYAWLL